MLLQFCRFSQPVTAVATLCAVVSLLKICSCATDESDEVLDKKQLTEFSSKLIHLCCCVSKTSCITSSRCIFWWVFAFIIPYSVLRHKACKAESRVLFASSNYFLPADAKIKYFQNSTVASFFESLFLVPVTPQFVNDCRYLQKRSIYSEWLYLSTVC